MRDVKLYLQDMLSAFESIELFVGDMTMQLIKSWHYAFRSDGCGENCQV